MVGGEAGRTLLSNLSMVSMAEPRRTSTLWPWGDLSKNGRENSLRNGSISHVTTLPSAGSTSAIVSAP